MVRLQASPYACWMGQEVLKAHACRAAERCNRCIVSLRISLAAMVRANLKRMLDVLRQALGVKHGGSTRTSEYVLQVVDVLTCALACHRKLQSPGS